ncbi:hypothetical protein BDV27DRAFT_127202 [Aspergillus caelatus]|uniref:Uncharacterized protein n=1 Tax=Aspergillus caelatus TaxID=61420 RepID=A0A5N7A5Y5_9EURO|nr:uncharacterized protein BDV27DRAFT_127202 [Aspergillus caelatus]KAE8365274.1 hypothetical protein BDV27DRAFT_127202 [Aspergillus caelatus]
MAIMSIACTGYKKKRVTSNEDLIHLHPEGSFCFKHRFKDRLYIHTHTIKSAFRRPLPLPSV